MSAGPASISSAGGSHRIRRKPAPAFQYSTKYPAPDPTDPFAPMSALRRRAESRRGMFDTDTETDRGDSLRRQTFLRQSTAPGTELGHRHRRHPSEGMQRYISDTDSAPPAPPSQAVLRSRRRSRSVILVQQSDSARNSKALSRASISDLRLSQHEQQPPQPSIEQSASTRYAPVLHAPVPVSPPIHIPIIPDSPPAPPPPMTPDDSSVSDVSIHSARSRPQEAKAAHYIYVPPRSAGRPFTPEASKMAHTSSAKRGVVQRSVPTRQQTRTPTNEDRTRTHHARPSPQPRSGRGQHRGAPLVEPTSSRGSRVSRHQGGHVDSPEEMRPHELEGIARYSSTTLPPPNPPSLPPAPPPAPRTPVPQAPPPVSKRGTPPRREVSKDNRISAALTLRIPDSGPNMSTTSPVRTFLVPRTRSHQSETRGGDRVTQRHSRRQVSTSSDSSDADLRPQPVSPAVPSAKLAPPPIPKSVPANLDHPKTDRAMRRTPSARSSKARAGAPPAEPSYVRESREQDNAPAYPVPIRQPSFKHELPPPIASSEVLPRSTTPHLHPSGSPEPQVIPSQAHDESARRTPDLFRAPTPHDAIPARVASPPVPETNIPFRSDSPATITNSHTSTMAPSAPVKSAFRSVRPSAGSNASQPSSSAFTRPARSNSRPTPATSSQTTQPPNRANSTAKRPPSLVSSRIARTPSPATVRSSSPARTELAQPQRQPSPPVTPPSTIAARARTRSDSRKVGAAVTRTRTPSPTRSDVNTNATSSGPPGRADKPVHDSTKVSRSGARQRGGRLGDKISADAVATAPTPSTHVEPTRYTDKYHPSAHGSEQSRPSRETNKASRHGGRTRNRGPSDASASSSNARKLASSSATGEPTRDAYAADVPRSHLEPTPELSSDIVLTIPGIKPKPVRGMSDKTILSQTSTIVDEAYPPTNLHDKTSLRVWNPTERTHPFRQPRRSSSPPPPLPPQSEREMDNEFDPATIPRPPSKDRPAQIKTNVHRTNTATASTLHPSDSAFEEVKKPSIRSMSQVPSRAGPPFHENLLPSRQQITEAESLFVLDENGLRVRVSELWKHRRTIVIFLRHWFDWADQDYMHSVTRHLNIETLRRNNVDVTLIGNGSPALIKSYKQIFKCPFEIYTDPSLKLYTTLGMSRRTSDPGPEAERGQYIRHGVVSGITMVVLNALRVGMNVFEKGGDALQLGGEFVFGPGSRCIFAHRMPYTRCHNFIVSVASAAGVGARDASRSFHTRGAPGYTSEMSVGPSVGIRSGKQRMIAAQVPELPPMPIPPTLMSEEEDPVQPSTWAEYRRQSYIHTEKRYAPRQTAFTASEATMGVYRAPSRPPEYPWGGGMGALSDESDVRADYARSERRQPATMPRSAAASRKPAAYYDPDDRVEVARPRRRAPKASSSRAGTPGGMDFGVEEVDRAASKAYRRPYDRAGRQ